MKKLIAIMILGFTLSGCAGMQTQKQKIATACAAATTGIQLVTVGVREGKINAEQQAKVIEADNMIRPICGAAEPPTLDSLKQSAFDQAVQIIAYYAGVAQ